jgi:hypothetical protein
VRWRQLKAIPFLGNPAAGFVLTAGGIYAGLGQDQVSDAHSSDEVRLDNPVDVLEPDSAVPYCLGIHHHGRAMLALLQTSRLIGANSCSRNLMLGQLLLEGFP